MKQSLVLFGYLLILMGCAPKSTGIRVFAAVSTREAVDQIAREFEGQTGEAVICSFASSSTLARQIEQGADADLFLSADEGWADYLADKELVAQRRDLLANRLVIVTPAARPLQLQTIADLAKGDAKRLALALDPVPAGHYAREALQKAGIWEQVKGQIREAGDVRSTLALVERDEADAGIVYATDAATSNKVKTVLAVPENLHSPIRYPLVLIRPSSPKARALYEFLGSKTAGEYFRQAGFQVLSLGDASTEVR